MKKYCPVHEITEPVLCIFYSKKGKIRERGFMPDKKQEHKICGYRRHRKWQIKRQSR
jgi:hypothetical protein